MSPGTLICFDYGEKRIGVAVGQPITATATALEIIAVRHGRPDWERIEMLLRDWQPQALVVGNPLNLDGTRQPCTDAADRFARKLAGRFRLPVHRADERLTTFAARRQMPGRVKVDAEAAKVILESWLAEQQSPAPTATGATA
ncbi:MAG: Holliday junction DNA helicase RuvA [Gammaproteobacteria bacterium RIFCSPLOWO2_02_FULL_61_13]|nr:MAG: Holliday junction DNA helicase RuvA [Gammaproteobacteria bacterium RIFCSPLOWO2_02_FULL_61_13]